MYIPRLLDLEKYLKKRTCFLFGPRQTGKSSLIKQSLKNSYYINLLRSSDRLPFQKEPGLIHDIVRQNSAMFIIIDEIQKVPELLDEVHDIIENFPEVRFLLTGSSSRKLKKSGANMLGGRARKLWLYPLTYKEISNVKEFDMKKALRYGLLPQVYLSDEPAELLDDYIDVYLRDEIREECRIRNLTGFERFLGAAAAFSGEMVNYANIANDAGLPESSVRSYFKVLEDTLTCFLLEPWQSPIRKAVHTEKYYLFDIGIKWHIEGKKAIEPKTKDWGDAFEHFIISEVRAYNEYNRLRWSINYWRDKHKNEVDLILDGKVAIEIKGTHKVANKHLNGLKAISGEAKWNSRIIVSFDHLSRTLDQGIVCLHWQKFLDELWSGRIL